MNKPFELLFYVMVGVGMAVSNTSFTVLSGMSEVVGGLWFQVAIVIGGALCFVIARQIGELAGAFPSAPGIRTYVLKGFGNRTSLFCVILYLALMVIFGSVESYMFALILQAAVPGISVYGAVALVVGLVVAFNVRGIEMSRRLQVVTTLLLIAGISLLGIFALLVPVESQAVSRPLTAGGGPLVFSSVGFALFLFVGFEWVVPLGRSSEAYVSRIPRSMQYAVIINTVMYLVFSAGLMHLFSAEQIASKPYPQLVLAERVFGHSGIYFALALGGLAIVSTFNAGVMGGARLLYALSREGYLPPVMSKVSLNNGTPYAAVMFLGAVVTAVSFVVISLQLELIFSIISSTIVCFIYAMLLWSLIRIKGSQKVRISYVSGIPLWVQYAAVSALALFGVLGMFSIDAVWISAVSGVIICAILSAAISTVIHARRVGA